MSGKLVRNFSVMLLFISSSISGVRACDVPVYRYALERWPTERYELVVFHRGPLSEKQGQIVKWLEGSSGDHLDYANYTVRRTDLDSLAESPLRALWKSLGEPDPPWLAMSLPRGPRPGQSIWSGSLTKKSAGAIILSEARREIGRRILNGEAAVWVLVESGDRRKDDAAAALLENRLAKLEKTLKLPVAVDGSSSTGAPDLRIDFSLIRLSRSDPSEEVFIRMLMHCESDLELYTSWPMAFPVFGRGRVLYALVGEGITGENILEACAFLVGPCACEIKSLNPGLDLLMPVDWEAGLAGSWVEEVGLPPLVGLSALSAAGDHEAAAVSGDESKRGRLRRNLLLALGLIVVVVALLSYKLRKTGNRS